MATTYTNESYNYPPHFARGSAEWLTCNEATREYSVINDKVLGPKVDKGNKVVNAVFSSSDEWDEDGTPASTAKVRLNDGSTQVNLVSLSTTQAGTANGVVQYLNVPAGFNYIIETAGFWVETIFDTAPTNVKTMILGFGICITNKLWGDEQREVEA